MVRYGMVLFCYVFVLVLKTSVSVLKPNTHRSQRTENRNKNKMKNLKCKFFTILLGRSHCCFPYGLFIHSFVRSSIRPCVHSFIHLTIVCSKFRPSVHRYVCPSACLPVFLAETDTLVDIPVQNWKQKSLHCTQLNCRQPLWKLLMYCPAAVATSSSVFYRMVGRLGFPYY